MNTAELEALRAKIGLWWRQEGSSHRWKSLSVKALMFSLFMHLEELAQKYDRLAQRCDPTGEVQMLHDMKERAEASDKARNETEQMLRALVRDMKYLHVATCKRYTPTLRSVIWDIEGCSRCRGEQKLEDLATVFNAEERESSGG